MPKFNFNDETVDVVWDYKYLGVKFNYNNKFKKAQQLEFLLASRAMFSLLRKCRQLNLPLDIQLELSEKCVDPILLYGCEIWACEKMDVISKLQLRFLNLILGAKVTVTGEISPNKYLSCQHCSMIGRKNNTEEGPVIIHY